MYHKYQVTNAREFDQQINYRIASIRTKSFDYLFAMLGCILIVLGIWWLLRNQYHLKATLYVMSLLFAFVLITVGITSSIIEVDARVKPSILRYLDSMLLLRTRCYFSRVKAFQELCSHYSNNRKRMPYWWVY